MSTQRDHTFLQALARRFARPARVSALIVDPDPASRRSLSEALPSSSYNVQSFASAREALSALELHGTALLVTEIDLPDTSGLALLKWVHSNPNLRHVLLMVVTSRRSVTDKIAALQAGADDYLLKPVDPQIFAEHMERLSRFRQVIIPED